MRTTDPERDDAIARAVTFLLGIRRHGLWHDFVLAPGWSDEWVTGYAGVRLHGAIGAHPCLAESWAILEQRPASRFAGWGFNRIVPQDADSTAWVLRLAGALGVEDPVVARAHDSMARFRHADGMLGTYGPTEEIRAFIGASADRSFAGWTGAHACVTAAAAALPGIVPAEALVTAQRPDGRWDSYWWEADAFATALAAEACADAGARARAAGWAVGQLAQDRARGAFETANLITAAALGDRGRDDEVQAAAERLLAMQEATGGWPGSARMRVPDPGDPDPARQRDWHEGGRIEGAVVHDRRGVFTTATALRALVVLRDGGRA